MDFKLYWNGYFSTKEFAVRSKFVPALFVLFIFFGITIEIVPN